MGGGFSGISFDYDEQGTDLKITDELGRIVEGYALDVNGRPTVVTNILGQTMQINYAIFDLPRQIMRFDGSYVSNTYDVAWRPATITYPDDVVSMSYSAGGLLQTISDGTGTISNKYDALLRWAGQTCPAPGGAGPYEIAVVNGAGGLPESLTSIGGTVSNGYYPDGSLKTISDSGGTFKWIYNTTNGLPSAVLSLTNGASAAYLYDDLDRISKITWQDTSSNTVSSFDYSYNAVGMITQKVTLANGQPATNSYGYDNLDRLTSESSETSEGTHQTTWTYDLAGNRLIQSAGGTNTTYTVGLGNRLTAWGTNGENTMSYNTAGCVTQMCSSGSSAKALTWDSRYRMTAVYTNSSLAESYTYDALDRRVSISDGSTTNYLVYNGIHCVAETDSSGTLFKSYTYGPGIDNILSMTVYGGTTQTYYYVKDHLGSVQAIVDASGSIVESYQYDAWGNTSVFDGSGNPLVKSQIGNRFAWQGREISWATRLYYFRARWYEPVTGRWLSNDPIGISGGLNQYVFCRDDPVNWVDPFGFSESGKGGKDGKGGKGGRHRRPRGGGGGQGPSYGQGPGPNYGPPPPEPRIGPEPIFGNIPTVARIAAAPFAMVGAGGLGAVGAEIGVAAGVAAYCNPTAIGIGAAFVSGIPTSPGGPFSNMWEAFAWGAGVLTWQGVTTLYDLDQ